MERAVETAVEAGHLIPETDAAQLGFELCSVLQGTNFQFQILGDRQVLKRCARTGPRATCHFHHQKRARHCGHSEGGIAKPALLARNVGLLLGPENLLEARAQRQDDRAGAAM
jgi:hypothetical protein